MRLTRFWLWLPSLSGEGLGKRAVATQKCPSPHGMKGDGAPLRCICHGLLVRGQGMSLAHPLASGDQYIGDRQQHALRQGWLGLAAIPHASAQARPCGPGRAGVRGSTRSRDWGQTWVTPPIWAGQPTRRPGELPPHDWDTKYIPWQINKVNRYIDFISNSLDIHPTGMSGALGYNRRRQRNSGYLRRFQEVH